MSRSNPKNGTRIAQINTDFFNTLKKSVLIRVIRVPLLFLLLAALLAWILSTRQPPAQAQASIIGLAGTPSGGQYARVEGPQKLSFPQDFGPHPDFQTEWWYYTGNLQTPDGRHFGFQLTFFRRAIEPPADWTPRPSDWATDQVYLAHFTLSDVSAQKFHYFEHFERGAAGRAGAPLDAAGAAGLAGATVSNGAFQIWLHDWSVEQSGANTYHLRAEEQGVAIDLQLTDTKGPILQGDRGYSQKGLQPGNASLYFSQTHLETQGMVTVGGSSFSVRGLSWMDREISTSALSKGEVGWDWFALQLNDGSELMAYVLRRSDGTVSAFSSGTYIAPDGETRHLARADFQIAAQSTWRSPHSGAVYPSRWNVRVPSLGIELEVQPLLADQELNVSFIYWEGAVQFSGTHAGKAVAGYGYVEMTGYAKSMEGTL